MGGDPSKKARARPSPPTHEPHLVADVFCFYEPYLQLTTQALDHVHGTDFGCPLGCLPLRLELGLVCVVPQGLHNMNSDNAPTGTGELERARASKGLHINIDNSNNQQLRQPTITRVRPHTRERVQALVNWMGTAKCAPFMTLRKSSALAALAEMYTAQHGTHTWTWPHRLPAHTHTHPQAHRRAHTHRRARTHAHARTQAHTHTNTGMHAHTQAGLVRTHLNLEQVCDPLLVAERLANELAQGRVAERQPAALRDAVGLVLELLRPQLRVGGRCPRQRVEAPRGKHSSQEASEMQ